MARFLFFLTYFYQAAACAVFCLVFFLTLFGIPRYRHTGIPLFLGLDAFVDLDEREDRERHYYKGNECFHKSSICNVDIVDPVFFNHEVVDDKVLSFHRVLAHIIFQ